jgi:hypothetical protein
VVLIIFNNREFLFLLKCFLRLHFIYVDHSFILALDSAFFLFVHAHKTDGFSNDNNSQGKVFQKLGRRHRLRFETVTARLFDALPKVGTLVDDARVAGRGPEQATAEATQGQDFGVLELFGHAVFLAQRVIDGLPVFVVVLDVVQVHFVEDCVDLQPIEVEVGEFAPHTLLGDQGGQ